jgi:hypothetical protein
MVSGVQTATGAAQPMLEARAGAVAAQEMREQTVPPYGPAQRDPEWSIVAVLRFERPTHCSPTHRTATRPPLRQRLRRRTNPRIPEEQTRALRRCALSRDARRQACVRRGRRWSYPSVTPGPARWVLRCVRRFQRETAKALRRGRQVRHRPIRNSARRFRRVLVDPQSRSRTEPPKVPYVHMALPRMRCSGACRFNSRNSRGVFATQMAFRGLRGHRDPLASPAHPQVPADCGAERRVAKTSGPSRVCSVRRMIRGQPNGE